MAEIEPRTLQGFFDYLPKQMEIRQYVIEVWREIFQRYGYGQLETPVLEYADVLLGKYGEEERLIYHFQDQGERHVAMRYDQTVPMARVVAQHRNEIKLPFKRYEINRVWRAEAARKGRKREFYQCDIDIVGTRSLLADAEIVAVMDCGFRRFNLAPHVILISHRRILEAFLDSIKLPKNLYIEVNRAVDKQDKVGVEGVKKELIDRGIEGSMAAKILEFISLKGSNKEILDFLEKNIGGVSAGEKALADLRTLAAYVKDYGVPESAIRIATDLVRGLDYYTGAVFELQIPDFGVSALAGGGRYDNLCSMFIDEDIPGVGVAVGFERLCMVLEEQHFKPQKFVGTEVLVTVFSPELLGASLKAAQELRSGGLNTEVYIEDEKLGKQFQYADRNGIPLVVVIGPEENEKSEVKIKDMRDGAEESIKSEKALEKCRMLFKKAV